MDGIPASCIKKAVTTFINGVEHIHIYAEPPVPVSFIRFSDFNPQCQTSQLTPVR
jgi:hypothetical protein